MEEVEYEIEALGIPTNYSTDNYDSTNPESFAETGQLIPSAVTTLLPSSENSTNSPRLSVNRRNRGGKKHED